MTSKKRTITRFLKFGLIVSFLIQTGIVSYFVQSSNVSKDKTVTAEQLTKTQDYIRSKVDKEKDNPNYKARDYFRDLIEVREKFGEVSFPGITLLQSYSQRNSTDEEIRLAVEEAKPRLDPNYKQKEEELQEIKAAGWLGFIAWLARAYIYLLPWVFLLFVIWAIEGSENKKNFFKNPLGFIISLTIYPLIIIYLIFKWFKLFERSFRVTAELRATKEKIFCVLSDDEILKIKNFAKSSLPLAAWKRQLENEGKFARHSFTTALIATILFMIIGGQFLYSHYCFAQKVIITETVNDTSPPGDHIQKYFSPSDEFFIPVFYQKDRPEKTFWLYFHLVVKCLAGFITEIEHIPNFLTILSVN